MCLLVRKISRAKWESAAKGAEISADAITGCLRTSDNNLSVWRIEDDSAVEDAILAIVSNSQHPDTIYVALLHEREVLASGFQLDAKLGATPVERLRDTHCDICGLTYGSLGLIAGLIVNSIQQNEVKRFNRKSILDLLKNAIDAGDVQMEELQERMKLELKKTFPGAQSQS